METSKNLIFKQYQGCQALIALFKQIKQAKNWTNYQTLSQDLIMQLIKKDQELKDQWSENNLMVANQLNEQLWNQKLLKDCDQNEFWDRDEAVINLNDFVHLCGFAIKIISADCAQEQEDEQLVLKNNEQIQVIKINDKISAIIKDWPLTPVFATQFKNDLKYRFVFKNDQVRSYLVVDVDYHQYDTLVINSDDWKAIATWISKAHQQLNALIATTIGNRGRDHDDYNLARMTITFLKHFKKPLIKIYWDWTYNAYLKCIQYGNGQDFWLWDEHEWNQDCYEAKLNCLFENGVYEHQRLRGCGDYLEQVSDHHYAYSVQNFHQDEDYYYTPQLRWKFPSFYGVFNGQEMIVFEPKWIAKLQIKGIQANQQSQWPKQICKQYLIGINISDYQDLQTIQYQLNKIANGSEFNPITKKIDFKEHFPKLVIICHQDDWLKMQQS